MELPKLKIILKSQIADIARKDKNKLFITREVDLNLSLSQEEITIIKGVRRSGKSSLLEQFMLKNKLLDKVLYVNFEDPQLLEFKAEDFLKIFEIWYEEHGETAPRVAIFDEIQNINGWEPWMNFFSKQKNFKVFITGSNSNLLSIELGSHLTGRHRDITIYPFSFKEILSSHKGITFNIDETSNRNLTLENHVILQKLTKEYIETGGFPRAWISKDIQLLQEYYSNIINRDIIRRKKVRNVNAIDKLGFALMSDLGRIINKTKLAKVVGIKDSDTIEKYIKYFEECFLGFEIRKFESSVRKQLRNQTKFYSIDTALASKVGIPSDSKSSYQLENIVFTELLRRGGKVYYWQSKNSEIDFICETKNRERHLIQVSWSLENSTTEEREVFAFSDFLSHFKNLRIHKKLIITFERQERIINKDIEVIPFYIWAVNK